MKHAIKRQLWCRWFHRWKPSHLGGYTRRCCKTCYNPDDLPRTPTKCWKLR